MPFKSEKQRRFLWAEHPDIARRWAHEYPNKGKLPMYAHKIKSPENAANDSEKEAALFSLRNLLKTLENKVNSQHSSQNTFPVKFAKDILTRLHVPHSDTPTYSGQEHVTPSKPAMGNTEDNIQNNTPDSLQRESQNSHSDLLRVSPENAEIAPILHKMGKALLAAQNLCSANREREKLEGRVETAAGMKAGSVVRLGTKKLQELENAGVSIPATLRSSSRNLTTGLDFQRILNNINALKTQQLYGQNPLPLGHTASSSNSSPVATYPGLASGSTQNSPANSSPGASNPMLAGSNASTSPISHMGGLKSQDNVPLMGQKALLGAGNAGFTGAANLHGNEKLPNMTEFASNKLGIPRFQ